MRVSDVISAIEAFAPLSIQESWDNSGLLIGSPSDEVRGVMVGFDCTPGLIERALAAGCDMVVTHHPLIFGGLKSISREDPVGDAVIRAVRGGVAVYAAHTTADKVIAGGACRMSGSWKKNPAETASVRSGISPSRWMRMRPSPWSRSVSASGFSAPQSPWPGRFPAWRCAAGAALRSSVRPGGRVRNCTFRPIFPTTISLRKKAS